MDTFKNLNDYIVYTSAKSKTEAYSYRDKAQEIIKEGKCVVVFFGKFYQLYLAPGYDPYQVRKDIDEFVNSSDFSSEDKTNTENTPPRDSSGKFVSKK